LIDAVTAAPLWSAVGTKATSVEVRCWPCAPKAGNKTHCVC